MTSWPILSALSLASAVSLLAIGCAPDDSASAKADSEDTVSGSEDALQTLKCDVSNLGAAACQNALASVRLQAYAEGRSDLIERGITWLDAGVTYNTNASHDGFRRDCSGFVSMVWDFTANPGTIYFPPFNLSGKFANALGGFDDLVPGDAVNKTTREKNKEGQLVGHVMLFGGWANNEHTQMFFLHEYSPGKPTALVQIDRASVEAAYIAIRSVNAPAPAAPPADPTPVAPSDPAPDPSSPDPSDPAPSDPAPSDPAPSDPAPACGVMVANQAIGVNEVASSCDGRFSLVLQGDGNLVFYQNGVKALWSTMTVGKPSQTAIMQDDGNLVIYGPSGAIWSSKSNGNPGAWLAIGSDGSLVIDDANGKPIWWDGTGGL